jgi:hypothetical protein
MKLSRDILLLLFLSQNSFDNKKPKNKQNHEPNGDYIKNQKDPFIDDSGPNHPDAHAEKQEDRGANHKSAKVICF